jgi:hypothetical protein
MMLLPLNALLIGLVAVTSISVMIYWHVITGGTWKHEPAGRSLMILLLVITVITTNAAVNIFLPRYMGKVELYFTLYFVMQAALVHIGLTIRSEMRKGKARLQKNNSASTGPATVTVTATNKESATVEDVQPSK